MYAYYVLAACTVIAAVNEVDRIRKIGPLKDRLEDLVSDVLFAPTLPAGKDRRLFVQFVLLRIPVASLLEVCYLSTATLLCKDALEADLLDVTSKALLVDAI